MQEKRIGFSYCSNVTGKLLKPVIYAYANNYNIARFDINMSPADVLNGLVNGMDVFSTV